MVETNEGGGDEEEDAGELEPQSALLGTDALQPQRHLASATQPPTNQDVQRRDDDDRHDRDQTAVDRVHHEVGKLVVLTTTADLHTVAQ